jgi:hypothetical protein
MVQLIELFEKYIRWKILALFLEQLKKPATDPDQTNTSYQQHHGLSEPAASAFCFSNISS